MTNLSDQISATLDAWAHPGFIETTKVLSSAEYAALVARFKAAHEGPRKALVIAVPPTTLPPFDRMAAALSAVLDLHRASTQSGDWARGPYWACEQCIDEQDPCPTLRAIAEALGLEVADS